MVLLVGERFPMGSAGPDARAADGEGPVREVELSRYPLDRTPT